MSRQKLLLFFVAILAAIKFLVMPSFGYLDEQLAIITSLNDKRQKERNILEQKQEIDNKLRIVNEHFSKVKELAFAADSVDIGVLMVQRMIEDSAKKNGVKINRLTWLEPNSVDSNKRTIQLFVKGIPGDWVMLQNELESRSWLSLRRMSFVFSRSSGELSLIGEISGIIAYDVNFWVTNDDDV